MLLSTKTVVAVLLGLSGTSKLFVLAQTDYPTVANTFECAVAPSPQIYDQYTTHAGDVVHPEYDVPTARETPSPTVHNTPAPTLHPTASPTIAPFAQVQAGPATQPVAPNTMTQSASLSGCQTSYAYCPGISTCFTELNGGSGGGAWGWSIDLSSLQSGQTLTCPVYAGAGQCDLTKGVEVGQLVITQYSVTWNYYQGVGGQDFHFYSGKCSGCDGGQSLPNSACDPYYEGKYQRTPGQYTLLGGSYAKGYTSMEYSSSNYINYREGSSPWGQYQYVPFPIGAGGWQYIAAHSTVCPCGGANQYCY